MKQRIVTMILAVLMFGLVGCSKNAETVSVDLTEVRSALISAQGTNEAYLLETDALKNLYGIEAEDVQQSASYATMAGTFPDEVILVQAVDEKAAERIQTSLETRLDEVKVQSQTYDPENYAAAMACSVRVDSTYVALILSPQQELLQEVYDGFFTPAE